MVFFILKTSKVELLKLSTIHFFFFFLAFRFAILFLSTPKSNFASLYWHCCKKNQRRQYNHEIQENKIKK